MLTKSMKMICLLALLEMAALASPNSAAAATTRTSPYTSSNIYVGVYSPTGDSWVAFQQKGTTNCTWYQLGNSSSLFDSYNIEGGSGADYFRINMASGAFTCSGTTYNLYTGIAYGTGNWIDSYGYAGADEMRTASANASSWTKGGSDNDEVRGYASSVSLFGEDGDDKVEGFGGGTGEYYDGGNNNDCVQDFNGSHSTLSCGAGSDNYKTTGTAQGDCETPTANDCLAL